MTELINQLMSDEAVCRTAPATPGLLNMPHAIHTLLTVISVEICKIKCYLNQQVQTIQVKICLIFFYIINKYWWYSKYSYRTAGSTCDELANSQTKHTNKHLAMLQYFSLVVPSSASPQLPTLHPLAVGLQRSGYLSGYLLQTRHSY